MAQRITTLFIDDLDGGDAEGTVPFSLDGTDYEIDLNAAHAKEFRAALAPYIEHARKATGTARKTIRGSARKAANGSGSDSGVIDTAKVREWAQKQQLGIKARGRIPANVVEQYRLSVGP